MVFAQEMNELRVALKHVKRLREKQVGHRRMVKSLFAAPSPNALKSVKKRNAHQYKLFMEEVKEELKTPKLDELLGDNE